MPTLAAQNWSARPEERGRRKIYQTAEMFNLIPKAILVKIGLCLLLVGTLNPPAADQSLPARGFCIASPSESSTPQMKQHFQGVVQTIWSGAGGFIDQYYGRRPANDQKNPGHTAAKCF